MSTELEQAAEAPEPKTPGVTVTISPSLAFRGAFMYAGVLDGIDGGCFSVCGEVDHEGELFSTPEAAEIDCRKHLYLLLERLLPALTIGRAAFTTTLENLTFVRE